MSEQSKKFTLEELKQYNGKNGKPAYLAFEGKIYDVSDSSFWMDGDHLGSHEAGNDLTGELPLAPHGPENLQRARQVGILE